MPADSLGAVAELLSPIHVETEWHARQAIAAQRAGAAAVLAADGLDDYLRRRLEWNRQLLTAHPPRPHYVINTRRVAVAPPATQGPSPARAARGPLSSVAFRPARPDPGAALRLALDAAPRGGLVLYVYMAGCPACQRFAPAWDREVADAVDSRPVAYLALPSDDALRQRLQYRTVPHVLHLGCTPGRAAVTREAIERSWSV